MPEAQQTQGIGSITWISIFSSNNFKFIPVRKIIQVINSIPWVRCASGNVYYTRSAPAIMISFWINKSVLLQSANVKKLLNRLISLKASPRWCVLRFKFYRVVAADKQQTAVLPLFTICLSLSHFQTFWFLRMCQPTILSFGLQHFQRG